MEVGIKEMKKKKNVGRRDRTQIKNLAGNKTCDMNTG